MPLRVAGLPAWPGIRSSLGGGVAAGRPLGAQQGSRRPCRRTAPARKGMDERWRIELFGQLRLGRGDAAPHPLQRQKATVLLAYLAYHTRHPHSRAVLIDLLWPELDLEEGRHNLRSQLH